MARDMCCLNSIFMYLCEHLPVHVCATLLNSHLCQIIATLRLISTCVISIYLLFDIKAVHMSMWRKRVGEG